MANKTFADYSELISDQGNPITRPDYLVGYRPSDGTNGPYEIRFTAAELMQDLNDLMSPKALRGDKIQFNPEGFNANTYDINYKLNQFKSTEDYLDVASAGLISYNKRLFVSYGQTITLSPNFNEQDALKNLFRAIIEWHIEGTVILKIPNGAWVLNSTLDLNHPYGQNIQLIGDVNSPSNVNITMTSTGNPSFDLLSCTNGNKFGYINGITISGNYPADSAIYGGIVADAGGFISLGSKVVVSNCGYGIKATRGSSIVADGTTTSHCRIAGFYAGYNSQISGANSISGFAGGGGSQQYGYLAEYHSQINARNSTSSYNSQNGYCAAYNSQIDAAGANANNNSQSGILAKHLSQIECSSSTISNYNGSYGAESEGSSKVYGATGDLGNNISGAFSPSISLILDSSPIFSSDGGDLTIKTVQSNSVIFKTQNTRDQLRILNLGSGGQFLTISGGNNDSAADPTISVDSTSGSGDVNLTLKASNNGFINLKSSLNLGPGAAETNLGSNGSTVNVGNGSTSINIGNNSTTINLGNNATTLNLGNNATNINLGNNVNFSNLTTTDPSDSNLVANGYIACKVNINGVYTTVYLLVHRA